MPSNQWLVHVTLKYELGGTFTLMCWKNRAWCVVLFSWCYTSYCSFYFPTKQTHVIQGSNSWAHY